MKLNSQTKFYYDRRVKKIKRHNKLRPLRAYFGPMIGDKKRVRIANVGAGMAHTTGMTWDGVEVEIVASDLYAKDYAEMWEGETPIVPVEYQDFTQLTYPDNSFDIVHCENALDHTKQAKQAISELKRVSREWVYLRHFPNQKTLFRGHHQWNILLKDGVCWFQSGKETFSLPEFESHEEESPEGIVIVSIYKK